MLVSQDEFNNHVLPEILWLKARMSALELVVSSILQDYKPEAYENYEGVHRTAVEGVYRELLLVHPFLKDDFDRLIQEFFDK